MNIHDAYTIEVTARAGVIVDVFEQSETLSAFRPRRYPVNPSRTVFVWVFLTVDGDNQLKLNAGNDIVLQHDESGSMMSIGEETKAEMNA